MAMELHWVAGIVVGLLAGSLLGVWFCANLRKTSCRLLNSDASVQTVLSGVFRVMVVVVALTVLAIWNLAALLGGLAGFTIAQRVAIRKAQVGG